MSDLIIRSSAPVDLAAILEIERANPTAAHWPEDTYRQLWSPQTHRIGFVAEHKGKIAGFTVAHEVLGEWELENLAVAPGFQGKGIGTALVQKLMAVLKSSRASRLFLEVRESNMPARRLYETQGLQLSGRRRNYYNNPPEDALLFEKIFPFRM